MFHHTQPLATRRKQELAGLRQTIVALPRRTPEDDGVLRSPASGKRLRRRCRLMERGIGRSTNRRDGKEKAD